MLLSKKRRYNSSDVFLNESYGENKPIWDKYILKTQINGDDCFVKNMYIYAIYIENKLKTYKDT